MARKWRRGNEVAGVVNGVADHTKPYVVIGMVGERAVVIAPRDKYRSNPDDIANDDLLIAGVEGVTEWIPPITKDAEGRKVVVTDDRELHLSKVIKDHRASGGGVVGTFRSSDFVDGSWNQARKRS